MKEILFIADFFLDDLVAGAELNDATLIHHLQEKGIIIHTVRSREVTYKLLDAYDFFIVSNFKRLKQKYRSYLAQTKQYIIFEHDYKLCKNRQLRKYIDDEFMVKKKKLANIDFYHNAATIFFLTNLQARIFEKNLGVDTYKIFHTSFFHRQDLADLAALRNSTMKDIPCILIKNYKDYSSSLKYAKRNGITCTPAKKTDRRGFLHLLARSQALVFHTDAVESFCRVVAEAKMLNCRVLTEHKRFIGFYSEPYCELFGEELAREIRACCDSGLELFHSTIVKALSRIR